MKKLTIFILPAMLLLAAKPMAQTTVKISGKVTDNNSKPLQSVTVSLLQAKDSSLVKAAVTGADGGFEFTTKKVDSFLISYSLVGFETKYAPSFFLKAGENVTVPSTSLLSVSNKLSAVTVVSKKPMIEIRADKTVFNVEASINATGSNALELLQKSPGMQVDNNDNISMKGKSGVKVYVDGKMMQLDTKDLAAYLKSINSNDVEAIEMISNPSAKYDASGNAGIVNIRLKKNKKFGTNGSTNLGFVQGVTPKGNGSVNLNYRDKKINLFSNVGANIGQYQNPLRLYRIQKDTAYKQMSLNQNSNKNINIKAGADYFMDNKNTIGVLVTTNFGDNEWSSTTNTPIFYNPTGKFVKNL